MQCGKYIHCYFSQNLSFLQHISSMWNLCWGVKINSSVIMNCAIENQKLKKNIVLLSVPWFESKLCCRPPTSIGRHKGLFDFFVLDISYLNKMYKMEWSWHQYFYCQHSGLNRHIVVDHSFGTYFILPLYIATFMNVQIMKTCLVKQITYMYSVWSENTVDLKNKNKFHLTWWAFKINGQL